ncbi:hypothetical protein [Clostridium autoethanogenum]|uniref:hypothetical protein n=1 Tax=Clostridium autoethanogenum TaxID=84023 RepID=UPI00042A524B|nr:hypothetical protein [Clostridium autoethanogenum]
MKVINISGNPNTGKTTLLTMLRNQVSPLPNNRFEELTNEKRDFVGVYTIDPRISSEKSNDLGRTYKIAIITEGDSAWAIHKNLNVLEGLINHNQLETQEIKCLFFTSHRLWGKTKEDIYETIISNFRTGTLTVTIMQPLRYMRLIPRQSGVNRSET